ncbi:MAG: hypothetical protein GF330_11530 [Candidatus Eisenbacteria bacterium]|nr:hypothetical protein [Candidatus Eisenbacteria bacterium]
MRLLAILGLCFTFGAVALAGDGDRICDPCTMIDDVVLCPMEDYQIIEGSIAPDQGHGYYFHGIAGGFYRFTFCEGGGWADFDTGLSIQGPGTCGNYLACNDDYCGLQSQLDWTCPYDSEEWIVSVDGYASAAGDYGLAYRGPDSPSPAEGTAWGSIKALFR